MLMLYWVYCRQPELRLRGLHGSYKPRIAVMRKAAKISAPMTVEHAVICGAQIAVTMIVAPLGVIAIAANAFAVTAESLCYMPGYGIGDAATTLVGQSYRAARHDLVKRFAYITVGLGMIVMTVMGVAMWIVAPWIMEMMSPVEGIQLLGTEILRIGRGQSLCLPPRLSPTGICRRRQHHFARSHEFRQHLGRTPPPCLASVTDNGTERSMDSHVCRADIPRHHLPHPPPPQPLDPRLT